MNTKQMKTSTPFLILKRIFGAFMLAMFFMACSDKDEQTAILKVRLTDAPGDYQQVNIDIHGVEVHSELGDQASGWTTLAVESGVYNLLELSNGLDVLLAENELPAGKVSQIRLILGANNSVKVGGQLFPLSTPSAQQSGLKIKVNEQLMAGITYTILLDFDAARSIVKNGNGTYSLKPVIRAITEANSGAIQGTVTPLLATPAVFVMMGTDTVATAYTNPLGKFLVRGVPAGTYTVGFFPKEGYTPMQIESVNVTIGNVTDLGTVVIL